MKGLARYLFQIIQKISGGGGCSNGCGDGDDGSGGDGCGGCEVAVARVEVRVVLLVVAEKLGVMLRVSSRFSFVPARSRALCHSPWSDLMLDL